MRTTRFQVRSVMLAVVAVTLLSGPVLADKRPFEQFLPADVLAYVTLDGIPAAEAAINGLPMATLQDEPLFKKAREDAWKKIEKEFADSDAFKDSGLKVKDLVDHLSQGQVAAVLFSWDLKAFSKVIDKDGGLGLEEMVPDASIPMQGDEPGMEEPAGERPRREKPKTPVKMAPAMPDLALLADVTGRRTKVQAYIDRIRKDPELLEEAVIGRYTYRGVTVHTVIPKEGAASVSQDWTGTVVTYAFPSDDLFVLSMGKKAMERVIAGYQNPPVASLARHPRFRYVTKQIGPKRLATVYVDAEWLTAGLMEMADDEKDPKTAKTAKAVLADLGVDAIKALGAGVRVHRQGLLCSLVVFVPEMPDKGLWKLLVAALGDFASARLMPSNAFYFAAQNIDGLAIWRLVMDMLAKHAPETFNTFTKQKTMIEQTMQMNLEQDVIAVLGGEIGTAVAPPPPAVPLPPADPNEPFDFQRMAAEAAQAVPDQLSYVALKDAKKFEAMLEKMLAMGPQAGMTPDAPPAMPEMPIPKFAVEEFRGFKLHMMDAPMAQMKVVLCVTPNALLYTMGRGAVSKIKAALRDLDGHESLATNPAFTRPLGLLPKEGRVAIAYVDLVRLMEFFGEQFAEAFDGFEGPELGLGEDEGVEDDEGNEDDDGDEEEGEKFRKYLVVLKKYLHPALGVWLKQRDGLAVQVYIH